MSHYSGPSLKSRNFWAKREAKCLVILEQALLSLRKESNLPEAEVELNRRLYFCLLQASRKLYPSETVAPVQECNNQSDVDDKARATREQKRPDFQWIYLDKYEPDPNRCSKQFVVECKRLGCPPRTDWVLNANYVNHGVRRFKDEQWAYAKRFPTGAMVGYCQNMELDEILTEVTSEARKHLIPDMTLIGKWKARAVSQLEHSLDRVFAVSPFKLCHLWVDLR
jgi:hypothetical protein